MGLGSQASAELARSGGVRSLGHTVVRRLSIYALVRTPFFESWLFFRDARSVPCNLLVEGRALTLARLELSAPGSVPSSCAALPAAHSARRDAIRITACPRPSLVDDRGFAS